VRYEQGSNQAFYLVDSVEGSWNQGRDEGGRNLGYKPRSTLGYFPCPPTDSLSDLRTEMSQIMAECNVGTSAHFHEAATGGQGEIDLLSASLVEAADQVMLARYIIRNVARRHGKSATFMPKPIFGENGSGLHTHLTLWRGETNLLAGHDYAGLSDVALHAIGGLIRHAPALCAFANPTTNSYKRLVPGFEAPTKLSYSRRNRSAIIRVPVHNPSLRDRRIEYRVPDAAANPYLLFSAMLMAAIDGIQTKADPGPPLDKDMYDLPPEELEEVPGTPRRLDEALEALRSDHEFLLRGDVFTPDVVDTWIWYKRTHEVEALRIRPHPYEFAMYYDI
jgi:glutamine synthetase